MITGKDGQIDCEWRGTLTRGKCVSPLAEGKTDEHIKAEKGDCPGCREGRLSGGVVKNATLGPGNIVQTLSEFASPGTGAPKRAKCPELENPTECEADDECNWEERYNLVATRSATDSCALLTIVCYEVVRGPGPSLTRDSM